MNHRYLGKFAHNNSQHIAPCRPAPAHSFKQSDAFHLYSYHNGSSIRRAFNPAILPPSHSKLMHNPGICCRLYPTVLGLLSPERLPSISCHCASISLPLFLHQAIIAPGHPARHSSRSSFTRTMNRAALMWSRVSRV